MGPLRLKSWLIKFLQLQLIIVKYVIYNDEMEFNVVERNIYVVKLI